VGWCRSRGRGGPVRRGSRPCRGASRVSAQADGKDAGLGCGCLFFVVLILAVFIEDDPEPAARAPAPAAAPVAAAAPAPLPGHDLVPAVVEEVSWERVVYLEARHVQNGRGWALPDSAEVLSEERRLEYVDERMVDGMYYRFRAPVWLRSRVLREQGDNSAPIWPRFRLRRAEREEARTEEYRVTMRTADGERHFLKPPLSEWKSYHPGRRIALRRSWEGLEYLEAISLDSARITVLPADSLPACREWRAGGAAPADSVGCSPPATR